MLIKTKGVCNQGNGNDFNFDNFHQCSTRTFMKSYSSDVQTSSVHLLILTLIMY